MSKDNNKKQTPNSTNSVEASNMNTVAVMELHVDLSAKGRYELEELWNLESDFRPGGVYPFGRQERVSYESIVASIKDYIDCGLNMECRKYDILPAVRLQVVEDYPGSIKVLFEVAMDVMSLFGGMKDTYECLNLIREIAQRYVSKRLIEDYGDYFHVNASIVSERKMSRKDTNKSDETEKVRVKIVKRDAFFYYLLVSNIGMIAILAGLVYKAVATMYWG